ncbi:PREDICTED: uncharacterized protein LOC109221252, partial [Nicotiana attenuata]|uniref:uncharacterized protein LOC109221252 n=1 Tax=Nicotiana attenuata TaxID=49451 RepID=UPI0009050816
MAILDPNNDFGVESSDLTHVAATNPGVNPSCSFYMHPSDNPGAMLVTAPFNGVGYRSWRRSVLRALSVKNKVGFITGEYKPPDLDSSQFRQWESVEYANNAFELWRELEDRYYQSNGTKLYQIQKEINDSAQGVLDVTGYNTKMKKLWEELSMINAKSQ